MESDKTSTYDVAPKDENKTKVDSKRFDKTSIYDAAPEINEERTESENGNDDKKTLNANETGKETENKIINTSNKVMKEEDTKVEDKFDPPSRKPT